MARNFQRITLSKPRSFYRFADAAIHMPGLREEYTRLRKVANERLRALAKAGFEDTKTYKYNKGLYDPQSKLSNEEIAARMPDLARFIEAKTATVGGMREVNRETVETLNDRGYDFINTSNLRAWGDFMDYLRDTDQSARFYDVLAEKEDDEERILAMQDAFERWQDTGNWMDTGED